MRWHKIYGMIYRDFITFKNVKWKIFEFVYFPITTLIIWGLFSLYSKEFSLQAGMIVFVVNIFWSFAYLAQSTINTQMMEDTWSGSFKEIMSSGIKESEYIISRIISSSVISVIIVSALLSLALFYFNATLIAVHLNAIILLTFFTLLSSIALSVIVAAIILMLGTEYGFLAWTSIQAFILLSAPFYPVSIFPEAVQFIAWLMPFTNIFESVRNIVNMGFVNEMLIFNAALVSIIYLLLSFPFYFWAFNKARKNGNIVKMS